MIATGALGPPARPVHGLRPCVAGRWALRTASPLHARKPKRCADRWPGYAATMPLKAGRAVVNRRCVAGGRVLDQQREGGTS